MKSQRDGVTEVMESRAVVAEDAQYRILWLRYLGKRWTGVKKARVATIIYGHEIDGIQLYLHPVFSEGLIVISTTLLGGCKS
jgi:hypothetical protein